jgi:ABC-type multidrug transport system fused ATPase/permease subunit
MAEGRSGGIQVPSFGVSVQYNYQQPLSRDYSLRYRPELDLVLKNISLTLVSSSALGYGNRTDQSITVRGRKDRNLWPHRCWEVICEFYRVSKVRIANQSSQLLLALFRILEPAEGTILIDGVDITKIGLHDLRSAMTIVPQSPDLFEGTVRENIDPVGEYQDTDIWEALKQVNSHPRCYVAIVTDDIG